MLHLHELRVRRGGTLVLRDIDLRVSRGEIVALVGANGAGKTTLLLTVSGILRPEGGEIRFSRDGEPIRLDHLPPERIVDLGVIHCPEGRQLFGSLTVEENLLMGAHRRRERAEIARDLERCIELFPVLGERLGQRAGSLSGGEQTMVAIARALMGRPRLLLMDEPSLGLAPQLVDHILDTVCALRRQGVTVLLVEQNARAALDIADRGYVLENGCVVKSGEARALLEDPAVRDAYLGAAQ